MVGLEVMKLTLDQDHRGWKVCKKDKERNQEDVRKYRDGVQDVLKNVLNVF